MTPRLDQLLPLSILLLPRPTVGRDRARGRARGAEPSDSNRAPCRMGSFRRHPARVLQWCYLPDATAATASPPSASCCWLAVDLEKTLFPGEPAGGAAVAAMCAQALPTPLKGRGRRGDEGSAVRRHPRTPGDGVIAAGGLEQLAPHPAPLRPAWGRWLASNTPALAELSAASARYSTGWRRWRRKDGGGGLQGACRGPGGGWLRQN